jgi:hypothetical protein
MSRTSAKSDYRLLGRTVRMLAGVASVVQSVLVSTFFGSGVALWRRMIGVGLAAVFALSLSSCISDPPPDPADAPIDTC